ncbi:centromere/microtubule-binding protein cbf5 [Asimina triloba]
MNAIYCGAKLMIPGLLRFVNNTEVGEEVMSMTKKGEAIAVGIAEMGWGMKEEGDTNPPGFAAAAAAR